MARRLVKVYLTKEQKQILDWICHKLGMDKSEVLRMAFMNYAEKLSLIKEKYMEKFRDLSKTSSALLFYSFYFHKHMLLDGSVVESINS